jgi:hypothetical protein
MIGTSCYCLQILHITIPVMSQLVPHRSDQTMALTPIYLQNLKFLRRCTLRTGSQEKGLENDLGLSSFTRKFKLLLQRQELILRLHNRGRQPVLTQKGVR